METLKDITALNDLVEALKTAEVHYSQLSWVQYTAGYDLGLDAAEQVMNGLYEDPANFEVVKFAMEQAKTPEDQRRLQLLFKRFEPFHLSPEVNALMRKITQKTTALSQVLNTHRVVFEDREINGVELAQILAKEENRDRRKAAYMAKNQINEPLMAAGFVELLNMRKELATLRGKESFVAMSLEDDELHPGIFSTWEQEVQEMLPKMKEARETYAKKFLDDTVIMPWDESFISAKLAPALNEKVDMSQYYTVLRDFFLEFDIDLSKMNITYDIFSRANKSEWGYNFTIEMGKDSRILANVKDLYSEYGVMLHETGHGVHSFESNPEDYLMNLGISGIISEGIANLFGGFLTNPLFYSRFFDPAEVSERFAEIKAWQKVNALRSVHRILFDQSLYLNPVETHDDVHNLYWGLSKRLFNEEPFCENPPWAFLIHHTTHPIYLHNYFMGDVTCAMLEEAFNQAHGTQKITDKPKAFGAFLKEQIIQPSGMHPYPELFEKIAGKPFSLSFLK